MEKSYLIAKARANTSGGEGNLTITEILCGERSVVDVVAEIQNINNIIRVSFVDCRECSCRITDDNEPQIQHEIMVTDVNIQPETTTGNVLLLYGFEFPADEQGIMTPAVIVCTSAGVGVTKAEGVNTFYYNASSAVFPRTNTKLIIYHQ